jgi:hypothetical protein
MERDLRYTPLQDHLKASEQDSLFLTYEQIEKILGRQLPPTAYGSHWRQWWANTATHSQGRAWMDIDWRVREANLDARTVKFERQTSGKRTDVVGTPVGSSPASQDSIVLPTLSAGALRQLDDYAEEFGTDRAGAAAALLENSARQRRRALFSEMQSN